jgi:ribosomal protein S18 acetylase RimI-like enzyme
VVGSAGGLALLYAAGDTPGKQKNGSFAVIFRDSVLPSDVESVRRLTVAAGVFRPAEIDVAVELVQERLQRGTVSGYEFLFAVDEDSPPFDARPIGYVCYGHIAVTVASYDLYWIVVDPRSQGRGVGRALVRAMQERIARKGGKRIFIETSSLPSYSVTRAFYERCGYRLEARIANFYASGDDKLIYGMELQ